MMCYNDSTHRKKRAFPPYVTLYDETNGTVRLRLPSDQARSQGGKWGQLPPNSESNTNNFQVNHAFDV